MGLLLRDHFSNLEEKIFYYSHLTATALDKTSWNSGSVGRGSNPLPSAKKASV
jgi:hypothetical protein